MMAVNKDIVSKTRIKKYILPLNRLKHLGGMQTSVAWYANFPDHATGDPRKATMKVGQDLLDECVKFTADIIKTIKNDRVTEKLYNEFFKRAEF